MNFLGHLWLADKTRTSLAGSILGDFVRGADLSQYPPGIAQGIRLHRSADAGIDRHPIFKQAKLAFPSQQRRFAGIVLDIALDHALALDWAAHHPRPLQEFASDCGRAIEAAAQWFEHSGSPRPQPDQFAQLLMSYSTRAGIDLAFQRVSARSPRLKPLMEAASHWPDHAERLRDQLSELLGDLSVLGQTLD